MAVALMERLPLPVSCVMATATMVAPVSWTQRQIFLSVCEYPASCRSFKCLCDNNKNYYACVCIFGLSRMNNVLLAVSTYSICFLNKCVTSYFAHLFAKYVLKFRTKGSIVNAYRYKDISLEAYSNFRSVQVSGMETRGCLLCFSDVD